MSKKKRLGEVLRERGQVSAQQLEKALAEQRSQALRLGEFLLERGLVSRKELASALEEVTHFRFVDVIQAAVAPEALQVIPYSVAQKHIVLPLQLEGNKLIVAMAEPQNLAALDELRFRSGREIVPQLAFLHEVQAAIEKYYHQLSPVIAAHVEKPRAEMPSGAAMDIDFIPTATSQERNREAIKEFQAELLSKRTPAVVMVSTIIMAGLNKKASDIHVDPQTDGATVRLRVDGVLTEFTHIAQQLQGSLVSRIKILADMDIAERRAPQDGRILVRVGSRRIDLRVATLPTHYGEKVVIRFLGMDSGHASFQDLGVPPEDVEALTEVLKLPQGMLLVTGPTGSGKTTTLYTALKVLRSSNLNIITVEDPVEFMLDGINHVQVHAKAGRTFASCLRSILRQDPNVIMIGEIRDSETAEIALTASQTGHLLLSTLHTNDSLAAITRLLDLGIPPFLISGSLTAIVAQRLVRKLCACAREEALSAEQAARLLSAGVMDLPDKTRVPVGCDACDETGYKGRVGIYEILRLDDSLRAAVRTGSQQDDLRALARDAGLRPMHEQGLDKARAGITSLEEVLRVIPFVKAAVRCGNCQRELAAAFLFCPYCGTDRRDAGYTGQHVAVLETQSRGGF